MSGKFSEILSEIRSRRFKINSAISSLKIEEERIRAEIKDIYVEAVNAEIEDNAEIQESANEKAKNLRARLDEIQDKIEAYSNAAINLKHEEEEELRKELQQIEDGHKAEKEQLWSFIKEKEEEAKKGQRAQIEADKARDKIRLMNISGGSLADSYFKSLWDSITDKEIPFNLEGRFMRRFMQGESLKSIIDSVEAKHKAVAVSRTVHEIGPKEIKTHEPF